MGTDIFSTEKRSQVMAKIKSTDTKPEILLRSILHGLGFRFRIYKSDLPGKPDIVLPKYRTVIFVHGCFWHQHSDCKKATIPLQNREFWANKLYKNKERDKAVSLILQSMGWNVVTIWECQLRPRAINDIIPQLVNDITNNEVTSNE